MQEAAPAENEEVIHCEEEHSDPIEATMHVEDLVQQMVEQATRNAELALGEAEKAAAEAAACAMELDMLLRELGI